MESTQNNAVLDSIQMMTNKLFSSIDKYMLSNLDRIAFLNSTNINLRGIVIGFDKIINVLQYVAESLIYGFVIYYLFLFLISKITSSKENALENPISFFSKALITIILIRASVDICQFIIDLNSDFSKSLSNILAGNTSKTNFSFRAFIESMNRNYMLKGNEIDVFSLPRYIKRFCLFRYA